MPIPKPHKGEGRSNFIHRCEQDDVMKKEYSDEKQRYAICYKQWRERKGGKK